MLISRKRYEAELEKARESGFNQAMEIRNTDERFRYLHERLDRIENMINKPKTVQGFGDEVTPNA